MFRTVSQRWRRGAILPTLTLVLEPLVLAVLSVEDERDLQCVRRRPFPTPVRVFVRAPPFVHCVIFCQDCASP